MATTDHPHRDDIVATWKRRPHYKLAEGVNSISLPSIQQEDEHQRFLVNPSNPAKPKRLRVYDYRFVLDEVTVDSGTRMPRLIHRRRRVVCEGVTVEEYIEPLDEALKRGQYLPLDVRQ